MNNNFPHNIAIIMDGNGRWAQKRNLPISLGHKAGCDNLLNIVKYCAKNNDIKSLTVYALSTENLKRPKDEVEDLFKLVKDNLTEDDKVYQENNIKVKFIGNFTPLPTDVVNAINKIEEKTQNNSGLNFNIAFCYGGRAEIVDATKKIIQAVKNGSLNENEINEDTFKKFLYKENMEEPDLIIRAGGEVRMSNFLLWELSYAELYFSSVLWPDFNVDELEKAIDYFKQRKRTFGERRAKR